MLHFTYIHAPPPLPNLLWPLNVLRRWFCCCLSIDYCCSHLVWKICVGPWVLLLFSVSLCPSYMSNHLAKAEKASCFSLTQLVPMEFSIKLHTIRPGWSIVNIEGYHDITCPKILYFLLWSLSQQTVQTLMKCRIMRHFIWVFTVRQRTRLGVSDCVVAVSVSWRFLAVRGLIYGLWLLTWMVTLACFMSQDYSQQYLEQVWKGQNLAIGIQG